MTIFCLTSNVFLKNILFLFVIVLTVLSCAPLKQPEFKRIEKLSIVPGTGGLDGTFDLVVINRNKTGIRLSSAEASVYLRDNLLGVASVNKAVRIQPGRESSIPLKANIRKENIVSAIPSSLNLLFGNSGEQVRVRGSIRIRKMLWWKRFSFDFKQEIDKDFVREFYRQ